MAKFLKQLSNFSLSFKGTKGRCDPEFELAEYHERQLIDKIKNTLERGRSRFFLDEPNIEVEKLERQFKKLRQKLYLLGDIELIRYLVFDLTLLKEDVENILRDLDLLNGEDRVPKVLSNSFERFAKNLTKF